MGRFTERPQPPLGAFSPEQQAVLQFVFDQLLEQSKEFNRLFTRNLDESLKLGPVSIDLDIPASEPDATDGLQAYFWGGKLRLRFPDNAVSDIPVDLSGYATIDQLLNIVAIPPGVVAMTIAEVAPAGWLLCQGQKVSKAEFPGLYAVIGGFYEQTETLFQLPDLQGKFLVGSDLVKLLRSTGGVEEFILALEAANLPPHTHTYTQPNAPVAAMDPGGLTAVAVTGTTAAVATSAGPGASTPITIPTLPPWMAVNYIIKT